MKCMYVHTVTRKTMKKVILTFHTLKNKVTSYFFENKSIN